LHRYYGTNCLTDGSFWIGRAVGDPLGLPGANQPLRFRIVHVMEFDDTGKIMRENVWLDHRSITAQLTDHSAGNDTIECHKKEGPSG
jgi:uncharacterized protein